MKPLIISPFVLMHHFLILIIGLAFPLLGYTQVVVSTSGNSYSNSSIQVDFTIGEVAIDSFSSSSHLMTQGFHQPMLSTVLSINSEVYSIELYPNPVREQLHVVFSNSTNNIKYHIVDIQGKVLSKGVLETKKPD